MKAKVRQPDLARAINSAQRAIESKSVSPIFWHLLVEATKTGDLSITASGLERTITTSVPAIVLAPGAIAIPAKTISEFTSYLPDTEELLLTFENPKKLVLHVTCSRSHVDIKGIDSKDFILHEMTTTGADVVINIPARDLADGLQQLLPSVALKADFNAVLGGVHFDLSDEGLNLCACDSFRLARRLFTVPPLGKNCTATVPGHIASDIIKLATDKGNCQIAFFLGRQLLRFWIGDSVITSNTLHGLFPDYRAFLSRLEGHTRITVDSAELIQAARLAFAVCHGMNNAIETFFSDGEIHLKAQSDFGESHASVACEGNGNDAHYTVNGAYLIEAIEAAKAEKLVIGIGAPTDPMIFRNDEKGFIQLVMLMGGASSREEGDE